ncbi:MAG: FAD-dependent oxidoreductase [Gracilibacteraceae bacterium]|jgi:succinate dehydrogenase/fumarate reductase flavoprotein subunit|nr:FAD-dependent oxidoreductase [Gracilibacteraceae bacterium]
MASEKKIVSRRDFLKGAAVSAGAAGMASLGLLAGCAPQANPGQSGGPAETPAGSVPAGGTAWSWETPPAPVADSEITETIEADIVVVGAGISGCACACRASELGASVAVVEKVSFPSSRGGHYGGYQTNAMTRNGLTNVPLDQIASEWLRFEGNRCKQKIVYRYLENSSRVINWLEDFSKDFSEGPLTITPITTHYVGPYYYEHIGTHVIFGEYPENTNMINAPVYFLWKKAEELGAKFYFNTPAEQLIKEDGRVTGVIAKAADGYKKFVAKKGVLLASGDFSGDQEMMQCFADPMALKCDHNSYVPAGANTGDGQKMGIWAGGHMYLGPACSPSMIHLIRYCTLCFGFMYVNAAGKRFMNEDTWIQAKSIRILSQPGENRYAYSVFDADWQGQVVDSIQYGGGQFWDNMSHLVGEPFDFGSPDDPWSPLGTLESGFQEGMAFRADTLEELAAQMGVDPAVFLAEVEKYNASFDAGEDSDFHKRKELLTPIRTAPFYAVKFGPSILTMPNGLEINESLEVLDDDLNPIPGLYASGNASGGRYAVDYPVVMNGNSHGTALTFGFLAGEDLAGTL